MLVDHLKEAILAEMPSLGEVDKFELYWAAAGGPVLLHPAADLSVQFREYWQREDAPTHKDRYVIVKPLKPEGWFFFFLVL